MKLLHVISSLDPRGGGPAEVVLQLGRVLERNHAHQSRVVTLDEPDAPWLRDFPLEALALGPSRTSYRYCPKLIPWLMRHASEYQAVIVHGLWQHAAYGTWRALHSGPTPYFVYPHGMLDPWFKQQYPLKHFKKWLYWPWADYRVLRDARAVLFTCDEERLLARQSFWLYRANERVVGLGIVAPPDEPDEQKAAFFAQFPELAGKRFLLFLGRIHEKKGCDLLIRAFAKVAQVQSSTTNQPSHPPPLHLLLAGPCADPAYLASLEALALSLGLPPLSAHLSPPIIPSASFPGMLVGNAKWGAFRAAEAFVLPSHQENFGIAVAEALSCGLPVLISDKVNIWREIEAAGAGMVENDTLPGAVRLLERWVGLSVAARTQMRSHAVTCFQDHFEIENAARTLADVLSQAIHRTNV